MKNGNLFLGQIDSTVAGLPQCGARFAPLDKCWVCLGCDLSRVLQDHMDLTAFREQDPELSQYTGCTFWLVRCRECGFVQPDVMPTLPQFFDRIYDQRWSEDWIEQEFNNGCKDFIFHAVLRQLRRRVSPSPNCSLLDIGAHVGRMIYLANSAGWDAEGIELNPLTSGFAARKTALTVHRVNAHDLVTEGRQYDAVTMIDVLEHIPDPVAILRTSNQLLKYNGWIAVKVPCGPNQLLKERVRSQIKRNYRLSIALNMVHINHFSPSSLRRALREAGFSNICVTVGAPELSPSNGKSSAGSYASDALRLGVYYLGRFIPGGINTPLALNLQAFAQRVREV